MACEGAGSTGRPVRGAAACRGVPGRVRVAGRAGACVCIVIVVIVIVVIVIVVAIVVLGCMYLLNFVYVLSHLIMTSKKIRDDSY